MGRQIGHRQRRAGTRRRGCDALGQPAAVERLAAALGNLGEGGCKVRIAKHRARGGRSSAGQKMVLEVREPGVAVLGVGPDGGGLVADVKAVRGVADGRLEQVVEGQAAEALRQCHPGADRSRRGDRLPALNGHGRVAGETFRRPGGRSTSRCVQSEQAVFPDDGESVAADAVVARFHHGQRDGGGNRGIHRIAASPKHLQASAGRQRLGRRHDVARQHRRPPGRIREAPVERRRSVGAGRLVRGIAGACRGVHRCRSRSRLAGEYWSLNGRFDVSQPTSSDKRSG